MALGITDWIRSRVRNGRVLKMPPERMKAYQLDALNRVLEAAGRTAPYGGYRPVAQLDDLRAFPVVDREYLMSFDIADRISTPRADLRTGLTTGTTGHPMMTMRTPDESAFQAVLIRRERQAAGTGWPARRLVLNFTMDADAPPVIRRRHVQVPGWAAPAKQVEAVRRFRPTVLSGPSSVLLELADVMDETISVDTLATYGEFVSDADRDELSRVFGGRVVDLYACSEIGHIAWQCRRAAGYHINADNVFVEILDDEDRPVSDGEAGHIILTGLAQATTPLVRYRIGDLGRLLPGACGCGITLPLMAQPEGRDVDCLVGLDGNRVSPMRFALYRVGRYHDRIRRWRLTQRGVDDLLAEVVFVDEPVPGLAEEMRVAWSRELRGPVNVELRAVDRLDVPRGEKFRWVRSLVATGR